MGLEETMLRRLRELLDEVDLATTTERQLRKMLEAELEIDLKEFKPQIRQCVNEYLEQHIAEQGLQAAQEPAAAANAGGVGQGEEKAPSGPLYVLSEEMARFVGCTQLQRTQCLKRVWEYIKANKLQNGKAIEIDDTLAELFEKPLDAGQLMKQMTRHLVEKIEGSSIPRPKSGKRKSAGGGDDSGKKPRNGGYQKELRVTPQLAAFIGQESISRPASVKYIWDYIKERSLQDPADKRSIICDEQLKYLFGVSKFQGFSMMKYLNRHFIPDS